LLRVVSQFKRGTKQYDVIVQMLPASRATPDVIGEPGAPRPWTTT